MSFSTENVGIGDKVIVTNRYEKRVGTVTKKTPSGLIDVDFGYGTTTRYKMDGRCFGRSAPYEYERLSYWTQEEEDEIRRAGRKEWLVARLLDCKWRKFDLEALESIWRICEAGGIGK